MYEIISKFDAKALGLLRYFTGKACKHSHIAERYSNGGSCIACHEAVRAKWLDGGVNSSIERSCKKCGLNFSGPECKQCSLLRAKNSRLRNPENRKKVAAAWYAANKQRAADTGAIWYAANQEKAKAYCADWYLRNKTQESIKRAARYAKDPSVDKLAMAAWQKLNPEKCRIYSQNNRAMKRKNGGQLSSGLTEKLMKLQRARCACCKADLTKVKYHLDHRIALSNGGLHTDANIELLCEHCNCSKSAKDPIDFMQSRGFLL